MERRRIGPLSVSGVGLGSNNFGRKLDATESASVVHAALDAGVNFFDTADVYGYGDHAYSGTGNSETFLGAALGSRRSEVVIATKFGVSMSKTDRTMRGGGAKWVRQACEDSLRRLGTDYIDLYQLLRSAARQGRCRCDQTWIGQVPNRSERILTSSTGGRARCAAHMLGS